MARELLTAIDGKIPVAEQYTTGEIAYLLRVAQRTASKLIDEGTIPGFRLPGRTANCLRERRVHHRALMKFIDLNPDYAYMLERLDGDVTLYGPPSTQSEKGTKNANYRPTRGRSLGGGKTGSVKPQNRGPNPSISRRPKSEPTWDDIFE